MSHDRSALVFHPRLGRPVRISSDLVGQALARTDPRCTWTCPADEIHADADDLLVGFYAAWPTGGGLRGMIDRHVFHRTLKTLSRTGCRKIVIQAPQTVLEAVRVRHARIQAKETVGTRIAA